MSKKKVLFWYSVLGFIILMQAFPSERPAVSNNNPNDLLKNNRVPVELSNMLRSACYDCHSNETVFPWYANVAPVKWLVYRDTRIGRAELNFSDWEAMDKMAKAGALDEIATTVLAGEMPMKIYPLTHPEAKLSTEDRQLIVDWAEEFAGSLFE